MRSPSGLQPQLPACTWSTTVSSDWRRDGDRPGQRAAVDAERAARRDRARIRPHSRVRLDVRARLRAAAVGSLDLCARGAGGQRCGKDGDASAARRGRRRKTASSTTRIAVPAAAALDAMHSAIQSEPIMRNTRRLLSDPIGGARCARWRVQGDRVASAGSGSGTSNAPTSQSAAAPSVPGAGRGWPAPRWSTVSAASGPVQTVSPPSMATLPGISARVAVGPPLSASSSSSGSTFS